MVDLGLLQSVSYIAGALSVLLAAVYYVFNMKNAEKMRKTQVVMSWFSQLQSKEYHRPFVDVLFNTRYANFSDWQKKYGGDVDADAMSTFFALLNQLDYIGFMMREGIAEPESIYNIVPPSWIILTWTKISPVFKGVGGMYGDEKMTELAQYVYDETAKRYPEILIPPEKAKKLFGFDE